MAGSWRIEAPDTPAFLRDLQASIRELPRVMETGGEGAGRVLLAGTQRHVVRKTGRLARGYSVKVRNRGEAMEVALVNVEPYAYGAEHLSRGRWRGFNRYGPPGHRFGGKALDTESREMDQAMSKPLGPILTIRGWASA